MLSTNVKISKSKPRQQSIGDYMLSDINLTTCTALAHFHGGGACRVKIKKIADKIKDNVSFINADTVLYVKTIQ